MKKTIRYILTPALCASLILPSAIVSAADAKDAVTTVTDLTVNYQTDPIGIETDHLRFGWKMDSNVIGQNQTAYQIILTDENGNIVWDSGVVEDDHSTAIAYEGPSLELETRYSWTVHVFDADGNEISSDTAFFETGCDWSNAQWLTTEGWTKYTIEEKEEIVWDKPTTIRTVTSEGSDTPLFRTEQKLTGSDVVSARLYITGLGSYEAYINGKPVDNGINSILAPGWTNYNNYTKYQTYDVTDYIDGGTIALGVLVGSGWYGSSIGNDCEYEKTIGDENVKERCVYAKMVIDYADGTSQEIVTDKDTWTASDISMYDEDGIYEGEIYNNITAETLNGWNDVNFDDSSWTTPVVLNYDGRLEANSSSLIYDYQELPMVQAYSYNESNIISQENGSEYAKGEIDFEQAVSYQPGDEINLKAGDTLVVDFGQNAAATPSVSLSGESGATVYMQPGETVSDGRDGNYAKGEVLPGACESRSFRYITSGNGIENYRAQLHFCGYRYLRITADKDIVIHDIKSVAVSSIKNETGYVETSNPLLNQFVSNSKWSQISNYNSVPTDCPQREYKGWSGDAQLFAESAMYHFDSADFLGNYVDIMNDYMDISGAYGAIMPGQIGGWGGSSSGWADAAHFAEQAEILKNFTIDYFVTDNGDVLSSIGGDQFTQACDNSQTALSWALKLGLYNTDEQKNTMENNLAQNVANKDSQVRPEYGENNIMVGFLGVNVLLPELSETGNVETAFDLMMNTDLYTFLYSVAHGATSIWETWDLWTEEQGYKIDSENHYSYGAASEWIYEYLLGIQKDEENPGFKHFILQPETDDSLDYANGSYDSYYGTITSDREAAEGQLTAYHAIIPANTTATLYLPVDSTDVQIDTEGVTYIGTETRNGINCAKFELVSGGYDFAVDNNAIVVTMQENYL